MVFGPHPAGLPRPAVSVGYPHPDVALRLVDGDNEAAEEGVLQMTCPAVMPGYHNLSEATRRAFMLDGFILPAMCFAAMPTGFISLSGAATTCSSAAARTSTRARWKRSWSAIPRFQEACVVPVADDVKGTKPVAFVVCRPGETTDEEDVRRFALANLAPYQHPRRVCPAELPVTGASRVDVTALKALAAANMEAPQQGGHE